MPKRVYRIGSLALTFSLLIDPVSAHSVTALSHQRGGMGGNVLPFDQQALAASSWLGRPIQWIQRAAKIARDDHRHYAAAPGPALNTSLETTFVLVPKSIRPGQEGRITVNFLEIFEADFSLQAQMAISRAVESSGGQLVLRARQEIEDPFAAPEAANRPSISGGPLRNDEIPGLFPALGRLINTYKGISPEYYAQYVLPPINGLFRGSPVLWDCLVRIADRLVKVYDQDGVYLQFARLAEQVKWDEDTTRQILDEWMAQPADQIATFFYSRIEKAVYDTSGNSSLLLKIIRGEPLVFGGFAGLPGPRSERPSSLTPETQTAWERTADAIDRETDGGGYGPHGVKVRVRALIQKLEQEGKIGRLILDIGSGRVPVSSTLFYSGNHVVIGVDAAIRQPVYRYPLPSPILLVKGDVERLEDALQRPEVHEFMAKAHGETPAAFDFIVLSDILNYVDYRDVVADALKLTRPGSRILFVNMAGAGEKSRFSDLGVKSNAALLDFLKGQNLELDVVESPARDVADHWITIERQMIVATVVPERLAHVLPMEGQRPALFRNLPVWIVAALLGTDIVGEVKSYIGTHPTSRSRASLSAA